MYIRAGLAINLPGILKISLYNIKKHIEMRFILFAFLFFVQQTLLSTNQPRVIPEPAFIQFETNNFTVNDKTLITFTDSAIRPIAALFSERVQTGTSIRIKSVQKNIHGNNQIRFIHEKSLSEEGYELNITSREIVIKYGFPAGAFYATQTLLQLFPEGVFSQTTIKSKAVKLPCVSVKDAPRFAYRGIMLDTGRHFMPVDFIKRYLDVLALCKINRFHWHLTEDQGWRIEIKKYPLLTEIGSKRARTVIGNWKNGIYDETPHEGFYTQEDAREVVRYAAERFITVIPEIELPGHALAAIASYPELSCFPEKEYKVGERWGIFSEVFCPKPATFEFLKGVFDELFDIFPSEYYHIGGDECPKESWKSCAHCQQLIKDKGLKNEDELQSYFITEIEKYLNQHGKQIIGWDEILEGGLAPNATVMSWRGEAGGIAAASQKHQVIMTPNTYCYFDYSQLGGEMDEFDFRRKRFLPLETVYHYEPYTKKLTKEHHQYIIGVQGNVWTEYMKTPERVAEQTFPRAFALSEVGWTLSGNKNYDTFKTGVLQMFNRMNHWGMNYSQAFYEPIFYYDRRSSSYPKKLEIKTDLPDAELFYTTDGTEPTRQSTPYKKPLEVNKGDLIKTAAFVGEVQTGSTNTVKLN